ncbi:FAD-binding oxidoreductase [Pseudooceanicola sp. HF7]|uniref:NAD(P)/FAD-dependent oxidoreductase n=1 Tax=Pseudooceanicola sp. HF7 TaxID=2721560 RepID=UPI0014303D54|nr:FAD-dependent oxidoreductase [Pseudooceanicola sp. HF7]NIZ08125.1 FAD-dependent oxidoreductase [Pseudooceanicola sp. HF7]
MPDTSSARNGKADTPGVVIIGAGVIGVTTGFLLAEQGHRVTILDRRGVAEEASCGNAGAFAFTDLEPLASPGMLLKAPKWLMDPLGPLTLRPSYAPRMLPWLLHFARACQPRRHRAAIAAQAELMKVSRAALERLIARTDTEHLIRREGQLQVYEGAAEYRASLPSWELRKQHGIAYELLEGPGAIAEIQPGLSPRFTHAGFTPDWMNTTDPQAWTRQLAARFTALGGEIRTAEVRDLSQDDSGVTVTTTDGSLRADQLVLAAGAWSHQVARRLGDRMPLDTERGYNTTFPEASFDLRTQLTFSSHGFVMSRIGDGVRIGGAVELGGLKLPPNYKRADLLVDKARTFLPGFEPGQGKRWMGFRPSMPDSLPAIGRSTRADRVIYAFGHGHLGLTQSAGTAELVGAIVARRKPEISLTPFDPLRFSRRG